MENKIYVIVERNSKAILKFSKYNIETKAYIGKNGLTNNKKEGDGKTPIGEFELGIVLYMNESLNIKEKIKSIQITDDMYWVDDPKSKYYNQLININNIEKKDWNSAEHLIDYPVQYEYLIEIKTNPENIKGKGSAIFLHCDNNKYTAGCVAVNRNVMKEIIKNIDKNTKIKIMKEL